MEKLINMIYLVSYSCFLHLNVVLLLFVANFVYFMLCVSKYLLYNIVCTLSVINRHLLASEVVRENPVVQAGRLMLSPKKCTERCLS